MGAALRIGLTEGQSRDSVEILASRVGKEQAQSAGAVLSEVLRLKADQAR